jgi:hypothetical protein
METLIHQLARTWARWTAFWGDPVPGIDFPIVR